MTKALPTQIGDTNAEPSSRYVERYDNARPPGSHLQRANSGEPNVLNCGCRGAPSRRVEDV
jgi:hypothetical protein